MSVEQDIKDILQRITKVETIVSNHLTTAQAKADKAIMWKIAAFASLTSLSTVIFMFILALTVQ